MFRAAFRSTPTMSHRSTPPSFRRKTNRPDLAVVTLRDAVAGGRRDYMLGRYDDPASREAYLQLLLRWEKGGRRLPDVEDVRPDGIGPTISELIAAFWRSVEHRYSAPHLHNLKSALRILRAHHGSAGVADFGPRKLIKLRDAMASNGPCHKAWSRKTVNKRVQLIVRMFKWGVVQEMVPASVHQALAAVEGLRAGESTAAEPTPRKPVRRRDVLRALRHLRRPARGLLLLQMLTGARPGELFGLTPRDIDTTGAVWSVRLTRHKTSHLDKARTLFFGPRAQRVLRAFLTPDRPVHQPIFSPAEAADERHAEVGRRRKTPLNCGNRPGTNVKTVPKRKPHASYTSSSLARAINRGCKKAGVEPFSGYALRHAFATEARARFGEELTSILLGHAKPNITHIYGEKNEKAAKEAIRRIG
jgi:integrase